MPAALVMLDLRGFSGLPPKGQKAVFSEFLGEVHKILEKLSTNGADPNATLHDANTWGDSVLAIFESTETAARYALEVRRLVRNHEWKEQTLNELGVRIALHVADLHYGTDPVRALGARGPHAYGAGIVVPARVEPQVARNSIWVTEEAATHVRAAIDENRLRATLEPLGVVRLAKSAGTRKLFWLGDPDERPLRTPSKSEHIERQDETATVSQLQLASLRVINEYVEKFHAFAQECVVIRDLDDVFSKYHDAILLTLRLRARGERGPQQLDADVLEVCKDGLLRMKRNATSLEHRNWVPDMRIRFDANGSRVLEPKRQEGVAVYCLWANTNERPGIAVAPDVWTTKDIHYYRRTSRSDAQGVGPYVCEDVLDMYKPVNGRQENPPYRSILSAALLQIPRAGRVPDEATQFRVIGVLNITSSAADSFTQLDCAWADAAASLIGSLYQSCSSGHDRLSQKQKKKQEKRVQADRKR